MMEKTQSPMTQQLASINISSKYFIDQLETTIIQIARTLSIEQKIPVDPNAKEITREIVQQRLNSLLPESKVAELKDILNNVTGIIKTTTDTPLKELAIKTFHILKLAGFDNV